ncbi:MAG: nitroreductase family protein [Desulfobacterales bacterium]|jgi:nitroreductase|nr:nitroreductase family protein [Desulfobacterales bacterium]
MELMQAIRERRSVRQFLDKPVEKDKIQRILEAAHSAPSASNYKFWYFIVVQNQKKKELFSECFYDEVIKYKKTLNETWQQRLDHFSTDFVIKVPVLIVVCADPNKTKQGEPGKGQHILSTCMAIQNLMLAAHGEGLGTVWITRYNKEKVRKIFDIPFSVVPLGVIPLGYPEHIPEKSAFSIAGWVPDESLDDHVYIEKWGMK